jgi:Tfp pilus assembly protein PilO
MRLFRTLRIFDVDLYGLAAIPAVCILGWLLVIGPLNNRAMALRQEQDAYNQKKAGYQQELDRLRQMDQHRQKLAGQLSQTNNPLQDSSNIDGAIGVISRLCEDNQMLLNEITPTEAPASQYYNQTVLTVKMRGTFGQLCQLMKCFAGELRFMRIDTYKISTKEADGQGVCDIAMKLDVFLSRQE